MEQKLFMVDGELSLIVEARREVKRVDRMYFLRGR